MTLSAIRPADFPWFPYEGFTFCLGLAEGERGLDLRAHLRRATTRRSAR